MTEAIINRAPALSSNVQVDIIAQQFNVDEEQLIKARETLFADYSYTDTFSNNYEGWKGTAIKILEYVTFGLTLGGFGFWATSKYIRVKSENATRESIRNPVEFSALIKSLFSINNAVADSFNGKITHDPRSETAVGQEKLAEKGLEKRQQDVTNFQAAVARLNKAINTVAANAPADTRRALYAAFITQVASKGLSTVQFSGESAQTFAIRIGQTMWHKENIECVALELAHQIPSVPSNGGESVQQNINAIYLAINQLNNIEERIFDEALNIVYTLGLDTLPKTNNSEIDTALQQEITAIKKRYAQKATSNINVQIQAAAQRIALARNPEALKKSFLREHMGPLIALSDNSDNSEAKLQYRVGVNGVEEVEVESLNAYKKFLSELSTHFKQYVKEKEEEAEANINLIKHLLQHESGDDTLSGVNKEFIEALSSGNVNIDIEGILIHPRIDTHSMSHKETLTIPDYITLLKIVVGTGTLESPGSPTLAAALLDSLQEKGELGKVFEALGIENASKGTTALSTELKKAEHAVTVAKETLRAAEAHVKSYYFNTAGYKEAETAVQKAEKAKNLAEERVSTLKAQLLEAEKHVGSNAYVTEITSLSGESAEAVVNRALVKAQLTKQFTDAEGPLKALREALAKAKAEFDSVEGSGQADGSRDGNAA